MSLGCGEVRAGARVPFEGKTHHPAHTFSTERTVVGLGEVLVVQHEVGDDGVQEAVHRVQRRLQRDVGHVVRAAVVVVVVGGVGNGSR